MQVDHATWFSRLHFVYLWIFLLQIIHYNTALLGVMSGSVFSTKPRVIYTENTLTAVVWLVNIFECLAYDWTIKMKERSLDTCLYKLLNQSQRDNILTWEIYSILCTWLELYICIFSSKLQVFNSNKFESLQQCLNKTFIKMHDQCY